MYEPTRAFVIPADFWFLMITNTWWPWHLELVTLSFSVTYTRPTRCRAHIPVTPFSPIFGI